jgi:predicted aspartyl protease
MQLDTGAGMSKLTPEIARQLIADGEANYTGQQIEVTVADGSKHIEPVLNIRSITIGSHTSYDTLATVGNGMLLLGLPSLTSIGKFNIDAANRQLVFNK